MKDVMTPDIGSDYPFEIPNDARVTIYAQLVTSGTAQFNELTVEEARNVLGNMQKSGLYGTVRVAVTYAVDYATGR